ncbi:hypothetical protein [Emcibacter sp. SYSU 3D8]|uniref:hypothetical protein n=1 Tax=Emcibacter sp. SYSU 3D8 TaxID=3133969 RepID=UPI0031FEE6BE
MADPLRLSLIDDGNRGDHSHLTAQDTCYYLREYTSHAGFAAGATNNLISNLKKKPSESHRPGFHYKARAVAECTRDLASALNPEWLDNATLVPVPSSKARSHPDFDDRVTRICRGIRPGNIDVRELVVQDASMIASHEAGFQRHTIQDLLAVYSIDESLVNPEPKAIGIVDDVLTAGTHYRAMHTVLSNRFPSVSIVGVFIARRIFPPQVTLQDLLARQKK